MQHFAYRIDAFMGKSAVDGLSFRLQNDFRPAPLPSHDGIARCLPHDDKIRMA